MQEERRLVLAEWHSPEGYVCGGCKQEVEFPGWMETHSECECDHPEIGPHLRVRRGNEVLWFHKNTSPRPLAAGHRWVGVTQTEGGYECGIPVVLKWGIFVTPHDFPDGENQFGKAVVEAARDLVAKRIGFAEFKRIVRENS